jgi:UDP:flavonoid glycosyltransferase YjiC (YdhE family)
VLEAIERGGHSCVAVCDGVPAAVRERFGKSAAIRFEDKPLDLREVGAACDAAVLNAGHGATAGMLLAGKPVLLVPIHLEQGLLARAAVRNTQGALEASYKDGADAGGKLDALLGSEAHAAAARAFAAKYLDFDQAARVRRMVGRVEELIAG